MTKNKQTNPPRRCLVTGGAGFIGSHVVETLLAAAHEVAVLDNLSTGKRHNIPLEVPFFELDLTKDVAPAFREFKPHVVVHQAAQISVPMSIREPENDARINILGSIQLIRTALEHGVEKIVYASSGAAYGSLQTLPLREDLRPLPISAYGISKYTVEHYLKVATSEWGLKEWAALRYSNVYGPRQDPDGEAGVVAIFIAKLIKGESPVIFDDGELTRDYVYVADVAQANLAAVETDLSQVRDSVFNVSTGRETTVNQLFSEIQKALKTDIPAEHAPPRPGDLRRSVLDSQRAAQHLGWAPRVNLAEGLQRTAEHFCSLAR